MALHTQRRAVGETLRTSQISSTAPCSVGPPPHTVDDCSLYCMTRVSFISGYFFILGDMMCVHGPINTPLDHLTLLYITLPNITQLGIADYWPLNTTCCTVAVVVIVD